MQPQQYLGNEGPNASHYLRLIRRRKWTIMMIVVLTVGAVLFWSFRQTPLYESTARVQVKPFSPDQVLQGSDSSFLISMGTEEALVQSSRVAAAAREIVEAETAPGQETGSVTTSVPPETTLLDITYADPDPALAQRWAHAYAEAYIGDRAQQAFESYQSVRAGFEERITTLEKEVAEKRAELEKAGRQQVPGLREAISDDEDQLNILQSGLAQIPVPAENSAAILTDAELPTTPSSPNLIRNGALAVVVGLALGLGFAAVREQMDHRLKGRENFEEELRAPTLGIVPAVKGWRKRQKTKLVTRDSPTSVGAEAYRTIRTNLQFLEQSKGVRVITVTSGSLGEGKTTTCANLAVSLAQTGKRVIVVSCDLRKPRLHRFFGLDNSVGVTTILSGSTTLAQAAQRCGVETLRVLASGPVPENPAELLGSQRMLELIQGLRQNADYVVFDTPPVLAVSDALILGPKADGVIVVADAGATSSTAVGHVREQLEQVGSNVIGGIFNNFDRSQAKYYPGYYRYYYSYQYADGRENGQAVKSNGNGSEAVRQPERMWP